jgi:hypothetical protein
VKQIRKRITYANVMSSIAVFLVLGGGAAYAAKKIGGNEIKANSISTGKIKKEAVTTSKIKNGAVTGSKVQLSSLGKVPSASNADHATSASNADTVGGNHLGFIHVTFSGATPQVDTSHSSPGVSVTPSNPFVASTTCVGAPFPLHSVVGSVDFIADPAESEIVEATVVTDGGHRCPIGTIEVNTSNAKENKGVTLPYYLFFS